MICRAATLAVAFAFTTAALAAPPPASSSGTGKVSLQDLHFSTRSDATAHCDNAPVTTAADGSFVCSVPSSSSSSDMAINEKGLPGTKTKPASKPQ